MKIGASTGGLVYRVFGTMQGFYFGSFGTFILLQKIIGGSVEPRAAVVMGIMVGSPKKHDEQQVEILLKYEMKQRPFGPLFLILYSKKGPSTYPSFPQKDDHTPQGGDVSVDRWAFSRSAKASSWGIHRTAGVRYRSG